MTQNLPPPHSKQAEQTVLSAVLFGGAEALDAVRDRVRAEDFYDSRHRVLWSTLCELDESGTALDLVALHDRLQTTDQLRNVGGPDYLTSLEVTPAVAHVEQHADHVHQLGRVRSTMTTLRTLVAEGMSATDPQTWLQRCESAILSASQPEQVPEQGSSLKTLLPAILADLGARASGDVEAIGIPVGFRDLADRLVAWQRVPYIIAGRPGMGKSALAYRIAAQVAATGRAAVYVSAEMPKDQLVQRHLSTACRVDFSDLQRGRVDMGKVTAAADQIAKLPLSIDYRPGATIGGIRSSIRRQLVRLRAEHGRDLELGMIVIDYLQILDGERQKDDSRENEISRLCQRVTWLVGEFRCPVLILSQLSRACEQRPNKRPILSDLRESGAIEQDAYAVMFLYRADYYDESADTGEIEIDVAKNRNGRTGTVTLSFVPEWFLFRDLEREQPPDEYDDVATDTMADPDPRNPDHWSNL